MDLYLSFIQTLVFLQTCVRIKERYKSTKIQRHNLRNWSQFVAAFSLHFFSIDRNLLPLSFCLFCWCFFKRVPLWFRTRKRRRRRRRHSFTTNAPWTLADTQMELKAFEAAQQTVSSAYRWKAGTGIIPTKVTYVCYTVDNNGAWHWTFREPISHWASRVFKLTEPGAQKEYRSPAHVTWAGDVTWRDVTMWRSRTKMQAGRQVGSRHTHKTAQAQAHHW